MPNNQAGIAQWALMWPRLEMLSKDLKVSASEITRILNEEFKPAIPLTRSAVIGKIYRTRLRRQWESRPRRKSAVPLPTKYEPVPILLRAADGFVSIMELTAAHCRWPMAGDGASMGYCGAPEASMPGRPYCSAHSKMAYQR